MDEANPMVRSRVVQAYIVVRIQAGAARLSYIIVRMAFDAALAKRRLCQCAGWYVGYKHGQEVIFSSSPNSDG